jgi:hypothetical protein
MSERVNVGNGRLRQPAWIERMRCGSCKPLAIALLLTVLPDIRSAAQPLYTVTKLGTLPGGSASTGTAINSAGDIVGFPTPLAMPPRMPSSSATVVSPTLAPSGA